MSAVTTGAVKDRLKSMTSEEIAALILKAVGSPPVIRLTRSEPWTFGTVLRSHLYDGRVMVLYSKPDELNTRVIVLSGTLKGRTSRIGVADWEPVPEDEP